MALVHVVESNTPPTWRSAVLLAGILLVVATSAQAQFSIGLTVGPENANVSGDTPKDAVYHSRLGLVSGLILEYSFMRDTRISLQPGFSQEGTKIAYDVPGTEDETRDSVTVNLGYLSLPILARVVTDGGGWYVTGGGYLAQLQSANGTYPDGSEKDIKDAISSFDAGAIFGVGHFFGIGPVDAYVEFRFVQGLTNANGLDDDRDLRFRNGSRQLHFGLLYAFGS